jgi:hypothetical protein
MKRIKFIWSNRKAILKHLKMIWKFLLFGKSIQSFGFGVTVMNSELKHNKVRKEVIDILIHNFNDTCESLGSYFIPTIRNPLISEEVKGDRTEFHWKEEFLLKV